MKFIPAITSQPRRRVKDGGSRRDVFRQVELDPHFGVKPGVFGDEPLREIIAGLAAMGVQYRMDGVSDMQPKLAALRREPGSDVVQSLCSENNDR